MVKGEGVQTKVHYKGKEDDFIVFAESVQIVKDWKSDKSIALAQVVNSFKVFVTHKQGAQGQLDTASKSTLENEFGTTKEDDIIAIILEKGDIQEVEQSGRDGSKNDSKGARAGH